jgi:hypothetical protein
MTMPLPEKYQKTGIKVHDDLARAYRYGDDTEFLEAFDAFKKVTDRLEGISFIPIEYGERLKAIDPKRYA